MNNSDNKPIHECQCIEPGFCNIYGAFINRVEYRQCQTNARYREFLAKKHGIAGFTDKDIKDELGNTLSITNAINFAKAMGHATSVYVKEGELFSSPEEYEKRLQICNDCNCWNEETKSFEVGVNNNWRVAMRCGHCKCFLIGKAKLAASTCPVGKWNSTIPEINKTDEHTLP